MLPALLIGSLALILNMLIQVVAIVAMIRYTLRQLDSSELPPSAGTDFKVVSMILMILFSGHLLQFATWAALFMGLGEFSNFDAAFYHSVVNFTSLGYGDIVMSDKWRLLGGLEAANGILMFGLTAGSIMAAMSRLFSRHKEAVLSKNDKTVSHDAE